MTFELNSLSEDDWEFRRPRMLCIAITALAPLSIAAASVGLLMVGLPVLPWFGAAMFVITTAIFAVLLAFWLIAPAFGRALMAILIADFAILIWFVVMADDGDVPGTIMSIWLVGSFLMWLLGTPIAFLCVLLFGYIAPGRIFGR
ncbi:MAG: hypothetical protein ACPGQM_11190 [Alphaproteobacteria bacterium]